MAQEGVVEAVAADQENGSDVTAAAGFAALKPKLVVPGLKADEAVQFYKAAFGAEELRRVKHSKRKAEKETPLIMCAELKIGESVFLVCDQTDGAAGENAEGGGVVFVLETEDVEAAVKKAVQAGAVPEGEISEGETPYGGGLCGKLRDPVGQVWLISSVGKGCFVCDA